MLSSTIRQGLRACRRETFPISLLSTKRSICSTSMRSNIHPLVAAASDPMSPVFPPEIEKFADEYAALSEFDRRDVILCYEAKLGIDSLSFVASASTETGEKEEKKEEKTSFDLKLSSFDAKNKIKVIKEVRAITGLGLKEAKELVEGVPKVLKSSLKKEEAEELIAKLKEVGAVAELE